MSHLKCLIVISSIISVITISTNAGLYENSRALSVSGGEDHTLVLTADVNVWTCGPDWGLDHGIPYWGVLGIGDNATEQPLLVRVHDGDMNTTSNFLENIIAVDAGWKHSLAIDVNNFVLSWGWNSQGQLGDPQVEYSTSPIRVKSGAQDPGHPNTLLQNIIAVSAGRSGEFSLALDDSNQCWSWGLNHLGQLGDGSTVLNRLTPVQVHGPNDIGFLSDIVCISAGEAHSAAVNSNGGVWCWGENGFEFVNDSGKLGIGPDAGDQTTPVHVLRGEQSGMGTYLEHIVAVSAGWDHTLALEDIWPGDPNRLGRVYTWGCNRQVIEGGHYIGGRLGDGTITDSNTPVIVHAGEQNAVNPDSALRGIIAVSAGEGHCLALDVNGFAWSWGINHNGELGNGTTDPYTRPVQVLRYDGHPLSDIASISAGYWHNLAIDINGTIWSWGKKDNDQLGLGDIPQELTTKAWPIPVVFNLNKNNYHFGIQPAIDDANDGNVLEAQPGTYYEDIDFGNKTVTLTSANPTDWDVVESTVIYGPGPSGGGVYVVTLEQNQSSIISGFKITNGDAAIACHGSAAPLITNCLLTDNEYNGLYVYESANVEVVNTRIVSNGLGGGDYHAGVYCSGLSTAVTLTGCVITDNIQDGIYTYFTPNVHIANCSIGNNGRHGIFINDCVEPFTTEILNNWIYNNGTTGSGNGLYTSYQSALISVAVARNNTIVNNATYGIDMYSGEELAVSNCIVYNNGNTTSDNIHKTYDNFDVSYSCVEGGFTGTHNIGDDPCFVDPNWATDPDANNFHIKPESRCIDNANTALVADPNELDIDGEDRIVNGGYSDDVDMGADELYWPKCDYDRSEIVNFIDFAYFANAWRDYNDTIDLDDDDDSFVEIEDLKLFCSDWLWIAPWSAQYEQMMMAGGDGGAMAMSSVGVCVAPALPALTSSTTTTAESEPLSAERIEELIDWTESLLEDEERTLDESKIQKILDSLREELN